MASNRFFIHKLIRAFAEDIVKRYGNEGQNAMLFPSPNPARRCLEFMRSLDSSISPDQIKIIDLALDTGREEAKKLVNLSPSISAVIFSVELFPLAKQFWQHSGEGISSRRAEFCHELFEENLLVDKTTLQGENSGYQRPFKGPKRYRWGSTDKFLGSSSKVSQSNANGSEAHKELSSSIIPEAKESSMFLEERFGRNLDISFLNNARSAIRRRIAGCLMGEIDLSTPQSSNPTPNNRGVVGLSEADVYLYPCGMNAIFHTHRMLMKARGSFKSISFGFPYVDTLKILEKFGPGCVFYGNGSSEDLDDLEKRLEAGERYLALFCEFPGNPLLQCVDLKRIRSLADKYDFAVIIDETISNFINVHLLPYADVMVSSLTKIFSGDCNVMGGSAILNPNGRYYQSLKQVAAAEYEDTYWAQDVMFMERNSRHFVSRIERINVNAEAICDILHAHPLVKKIYYPKYNPSRVFYDACKTPNGGYGGLLSVTFKSTAQAIAFYDRIETAKGPSLGTNFTLTSPYVLLAHFQELDWAAQFGVPDDLIRISVGLEDVDDLKARFLTALKAAEEVRV